MDIAGSKVLVIGGAGFIGSHLVEALTKEEVAEIVVYDNFCRGTKSNLATALKDLRVSIFPNGGDITQVDILNEAMQGVDYVFHLAALWLLHCHEYPRSAFDVNMGGTFNVLEACVKHKVKRLVYSSSASVYGDAVEIPMTEQHPFNNRTFYGATKIAGEQMCRAFYQRYGLNYVALRYMNVYGARQDYHGAYTSVIMKAIDRIEQNKPPIIFGDGSQIYDFVYVEDVARANVCALKSDATDHCYNIGSGEGTTIKDLVNLLLSIMGHKDLSPIYEKQVSSFVTKRIGSVDKAKWDLGFEAQVGLVEGLMRLVGWKNKIIGKGMMGIE